MSNGASSKRKSRVQVSRWFIGVVVVSIAYAVLALLGRMWWPLCPAASLVSQSFMRQAAMLLSEDAHRSDSEMRSIGIWLAEDSRRGTFHVEGKCFTDAEEEVKVFGYSLQEIRSGNVQLDELISKQQQFGDEMVWESIGRFQFTRESRAYLQYDSEIIVGISCYEYGGEALVSFADIHVDSVSFRKELREIVESDRLARELNDLATLQINIEKEIDEYRARKKLEPLRD